METKEQCVNEISSKMSPGVSIVNYELISGVSIVDLEQVKAD